jgi:hypothetical protein
MLRSYSGIHNIEFIARSQTLGNLIPLHILSSYANSQLPKIQSLK